jgi:hypothetical protein
MVFLLDRGFLTRPAFFSGIALLPLRPSLDMVRAIRKVPFPGPNTASGTIISQSGGFG